MSRWRAVCIRSWRFPARRSTGRGVAVVILAAIAFLRLTDAPAHADEAAAPAVRTVTVVASFDAQGSGWRIGRAIAAWNDAQDLVTFVRSTTPGATTVYLHRYSADDSMGGYTLGSDVWLNENYHPRSTWHSGYTRCMSAQITAHELGHAIGLPHSDSVTALMYGGPRPGTRATCARPSQGDVAALAALYR